MIWSISVGTLISNFTIGFERYEAMGKTDGNEKLVTVFGSKFSPNPLTISW